MTSPGRISNPEDDYIHVRDINGRVGAMDYQDINTIFVLPNEGMALLACH